MSALPSHVKTEHHASMASTASRVTAQEDLLEDCVKLKSTSVPLLHVKTAAIVTILSTNTIVFALLDTTELIAKKVLSELFNFFYFAKICRY